MNSELIVLSGNSSRATQFNAYINEGQAPRRTPRNQSFYAKITYKKNSMILHVSLRHDTKPGLIELNPMTHARTLQVATGDQIKLEIIDSPSELSAVTLLNERLHVKIVDPIFEESIYLGFGYYVWYKQNIFVVHSASEGLYTFNDRQKQLVAKSIEVSAYDMTFDTTTELMESREININFCNMGIGGLREQMNKLIKQVLVSRIIDVEMKNKYAVSDIKGILLWGPPGTGKTLIARNIAKIVPNSVIRVVNGPELLNKYYGQTESNIRELFEPARSSPHKLHVIIFDEIDGIGKRRGENTHDDKVLTQLLTMIDGVASDTTNNVLVIGITNRKDVLDPALIRSGRLECHIEIGLPSQEGRCEILDIYLNPLRAGNLVMNVDSKEWAKTLDGYSGADIESLIQRAKNLALLRNCDITEETIKQHDKRCELSALTNEDMILAARDFNPTFSKNDDIVRKYVDAYPLVDRSELERTIRDIQSSLKSVMTKPYTLILENADETVRAMACHVAVSLVLPYVRYVSYNGFLGHASLRNCNLLESAYYDCLQAERAVLILDSLSDVGDRALMLKERFIVESPLEAGKQLVVIKLKSEYAF